MRAAFANFALFRQRDFALLWTAGLISTTGDAALFVALPLHAYQVTGSAVASGAVFAAGIMPTVLFGSLAGVFVDRWDRKRTMVAADLLRALLLLPLLFVGSPAWLWLIFAVRAALSGGTIFFAPAENALLPRLVGEQHLVAANSLNALNNLLGILIGPAVGGVVVAASGMPGIASVTAFAFLASGGLIARIRASGRAEPGEPGDVHDTDPFRRALLEWRDGVRLVRQGWGLRVTFLALGVGMVAEGVFFSSFPALTLDVLQGGPQGAGLLLSAQAVGGLVAGLIVTARAAQLTPWKLLAGGLIGVGIGDFGFAAAGLIAGPGLTAVVVAAAFLALGGLPGVAYLTGSASLLQLLAPDAYRGRVFGALETIKGLATLMGIACAGPAIDRLGVVPVFMTGATMWIVGGLIALGCFARHPPEPINPVVASATTDG
ncbi:MAG: MFS transporter [Thermomicrobiales bacterium]|nr:MFS transporter [Thermomicrobiales bacterium]